MKLNPVRFAAPALLALGAALPAAAQQQPPAPLPAQPVRFPAFAETQLPNGLRLLVVENHALPVANVDLYVRSGSAADVQRVARQYLRPDNRAVIITLPGRAQ